ncbi:MAG: DUF748 domain-containing protein [Acidovorax sp.]|jgi:uncharacterized protein involved in outer membrane biogenesis|nr:DUF748 domain-containing protein [Acidovorax sp.]
MQVQIWRSAKLWRSLAWVLAAVLALWVLAWLSFPWAARQLLEKQGSKALGRPLSVGKVEFSPWSMELTLRDVALAGADGQSEPQVSIGRIYIDAELSSLLRWGPVADAIQVDSPHIRLTQLAPGKLDIQDILEKLQSDKPEESSSELPRFALYNIEISDGQLAFKDEVAGAEHLLKDLQLKLPFVSSLPSKRQVHVAPELSFDLNGSRFASEAQSTPFAQDRKTSATLTVKDLDLKPYLPYWPASLPLKLQDAVLQAKVDVAFEQQTDAMVRLSGHVRAEAAKLQDLAGQDWLQWEALDIDLADVQPLTGQVKLGRVSLQKPSLALRLDAKGQLLQFPEQAKAPAQAEPVVDAAAAAKPEADTAATPAPAAPTPWKIEVANWEVQQGHISWSDATVRPAAEVAVRDLNLSGSHVTWPMLADSQFQGRLALAGYEGASHARLSGHGTLERGQLGLELDGVPFEVGRAYVSQFLQPVLRARADGVAGLAWDRGHLAAVVPQLSVRNLNLGEEKAPLAAWKQLTVENARIDMTQRTVHTELLQLDAPQIKLSRDAKGQWMYESWLRKAPVQQVAASRGAQAAPRTAEPAWAVLAQHTRIRDGVVLLEDGQTVRPVRMGLSGLNLDVQGLDSRLGKQPIVVKLQTRVQAVNARGLLRAGKNDGQLDFNGQLQMAPHLAAEGKLKAQRLPLHLFESYLDGVANMRLRSAYAGFDGRVRYADQGKGPQVLVQGQAGLQDVYVQTVHRTGTAEKTTMEAGEDLLRWKQLQLSGLAVDMQPGKPLLVQVQKTALRSFFARVVVQPNGRLNLQDLAGAPESAAAAVDAQPNADAKPSESNTASAQLAPAPVAPDPMAPRIVVGPVELSDGTIKFSDFFIQPNYTADLTQLSGSLSAFSSVAPAAGQPPEMADLVLKGLAQSTASLDVSGKLNPLVKPLALDITAKVRDLELPPLTPYAVKYAGHGIERGKLSVDVHYEVKPDGMLTASNNLVLHQLTFGDAVQGAPASLPVKLAVALLADRNGVIDIDLPISGSLNDPQFRLGPVIFKVIGNLILKAVTAPFSLLAGMFSGDDQGGGGDVKFPAGVATLDAAAKTQLEKIAKSLKDKPALKLTVAGNASTKLDAQGWQAARLEAQIAQRGKDGEDDAVLSDKERESRLKSIYRKASIDKPRNMVGLSKALPPDEMRKLLVEQLPLPATAMQELAVARAMAVRSYLAEQGIDMARLFLGNSKADGKDAEAKAQLSLAVQ